MRYWFVYVILMLAFLSGCTEDKTPREVLAPIDPTVQASIIRMEQLLQDGNLQRAEKEGTNFCNLYFSDILGGKDSTEFGIINQEITQDSGYQNLYGEVQINYSNLGALKAEINQSLENYLDVFGLPIETVPNIYTFISGFVYQTLVFQDGDREGVGVSLDMFLGNDFPYKQTMPNHPSFSDYLTRSYNADHMVKKIIEVLVEDKLPPPDKGDFLSIMIWGGKKLYILDEILDFKSDTILTEYSAQQLEWCQNNQAEMWDSFFDRDLFYSTDFRSFNKLIAPAPTSPGMPPESPGATGNYMGWQVVRAYMHRHPQTTILDLIRIPDAQEILDESKYKPRR